MHNFICIHKHFLYSITLGSILAPHRALCVILDGSSTFSDLTFLSVKLGFIVSTSSTFKIHPQIL